jgi:aerobic-type carbon monoxide dehydrogenase small subunit (CoxS/CutS family)
LTTVSIAETGFDADVEETREVALTVNGTTRRATTSIRTLLSDFLRHDLRLTGTHVGCEHGACGACTVIVNGATVRSCLMLAVQADGAEVTTVEGLADGEELAPLQEAFWDKHGLQCGFCTPGILCSVKGAVDAGVDVTEELDDVLGGHICRCTGYQNVRAAVRCYLEQTEG